MSKDSIRRHRSALLAASAFAATCAATSASAGAFGLREQSATGQGASFAGVAAGGGDSISGMFWNPAVVNQVEGYQGEQHLTGILPSSDIDVSDRTNAAVAGGAALQGAAGLGATGDAGDIGQGALLTAGYNAYRLTDTLAVGLAVTTPFGLVTDPRNDWAGQTYGRSSRVTSVNVSPTVGYQVNDWFSVAVGAQIQYFSIRLRSDAGILTTSPTATLKGDDYGFGFTAGFTVAPMEGTSIGVGFRSAIKHELQGSFRIDGGSKTYITADVTLPEQVTVGLRQKVTDQLTLLGGAEWTNWSRLGTVGVDVRKGAAGPGTPDSLPFDYDDGWFFSAGGEYAFSPDLTVRAGVGYEISPIDDEVRSVRLPDDDRWWLSAGASYKWSETLAFDLGYSYVIVPGTSKIDIAAGDPDFNGLPFSAKAESDVHILSAAVRYKFGGEAAPVLVTKY